MTRISIVIIISILFLLTSTGCANINESQHETPAAPYEGENYLSDIKAQNEMALQMLLQVEPQSIYLNEIPNYMQLMITNLSDNEYRGGLHYAIDYHDGDSWVFILAPIVPGEELVIEPGETFVLEFAQLMPDYHNYVAGRYRVRFGNWYAEFSIFE